MKKITLALIALISAISFDSKAQWTSGGSGNYYLTSGNAAIGGTGFGSLLTVGSTSTRGTFNLVGSTSDVPAFSLSDSRTGAHQYTFYNGVSSTGSLDIYDQTSSAYRFTINSSGNVGIGTTSPKGALSLGDQSKMVSTAGLTLGSDNSSIEFVGSTFGSGYGHKIYSADPGNGAVDLRFAVRQGTTSWTDALTIRSNSGNVGIGTTTPSYPLEVNGASRISGIYINSSYISPASTNDGLVLRGNGTGGVLINYATGTGGVAFYNGSTTSIASIDNVGNGYFAGKVGIGTTSPDQLLSVNGTIHSKEVLVDLTGWSDYVLKPAYKLPALSAVKAYIEQNSHLPEIPSEEEMMKEGLKVGEMNRLLMKKVEELTLYLIKENRRNNLQQQRINKLERQLKSKH